MIFKRSKNSYLVNWLVGQVFSVSCFLHHIASGSVAGLIVFRRRSTLLLCAFWIFVKSIWVYVVRTWFAQVKF